MTFCLLVSAFIVLTRVLLVVLNLVPRFSQFLCFFWLVISLFKMTPEHGAEGLSGVPEHKKAAICLMEKNTMLHKFCSSFISQGVALLATSLLLMNQPSILNKCL